MVEKIRASRQALGILALAMTVTLWSAFALAAKFIGKTNLSEFDVGLIRFSTPALLLSPWWGSAAQSWRQMYQNRHRTSAFKYSSLLMIGGLPHFLLFAYGAHLSSAGLTGLMVPGAFPLFLVGVNYLRGEREIPITKRLGVAIIVMGVLLCAGLMGKSVSLSAFAVLLSASFAWVFYTLGWRHTNLNLVGVIITVSISSALVDLILMITKFVPSTLIFGHPKLSQVSLFIALMGVGTGLLSTSAYGLAVRLLGDATSAVAGALSPVLTALLAFLVLGERPSFALVTGMLIIVTGVLRFNIKPGSEAKQRAVESQIAPALAGR
jgi:drug/metabolite transporter (DMT)-like permease